MASIAVFGCGYWGRNHVRTLADLGALAAVCDLDADKARNLAAEHGAVYADSATIFADPSIDACVFALPAGQHSAMAIRAVQAGKHAFVEKPIALDTGAGESAVAAAAAANKVLMVGHILRYHNAFKAVLAAIDAGLIGKVRHIQSHRMAFGKFHASFDALWDLAPHDLSLILSVTGKAPKMVEGTSICLASAQADIGHIHLSFTDGITASVHVSRHSAYMERRFAVTGEKGTLLWDDLKDWPEKVQLIEHDVRHTTIGWQVDKGDGRYLPVEANMALTDELAHFIDCVDNGKTPLTDGRQGVDVASILAQCA